MKIQNLLLSSVIGITSIFGGVSNVEASQTCSFQQRRNILTFACRVVDEGKFLTIYNLSDDTKFVVQNRYDRGRYSDGENSWFRQGNSLFNNGTAIHF